MPGQRCAHLEEIPAQELHEVAGCEECIAIGQAWVSLRACLSCGHVGCCDSSIGRHATGHFEESGHPVIQSAMPGDTWRWCYVDGVTG